MCWCKFHRILSFCGRFAKEFLGDRNSFVSPVRGAVMIDQILFPDLDAGSLRWKHHQDRVPLSSRVRSISGNVAEKCPLALGSWYSHIRLWQRSNVARSHSCWLFAIRPRHGCCLRSRYRSTLDILPNSQYFKWEFNFAPIDIREFAESGLYPTHVLQTSWRASQRHLQSCRIQVRAHTVLPCVVICIFPCWGS